MKAIGYKLVWYAKSDEKHFIYIVFIVNAAEVIVKNVNYYDYPMPVRVTDTVEEAS